MFKIWGAKNRRTNLHKHLGPPFQIRGGPGSFSNAIFKLCMYHYTVVEWVEISQKKFAGFFGPRMLVRS